MTPDTQRTLARHALETAAHKLALAPSGGPGVWVAVYPAMFSALTLLIPWRIGIAPTSIQFVVVGTTILLVGAFLWVCMLRVVTPRSYSINILGTHLQNELGEHWSHLTPADTLEVARRMSQNIRLYTLAISILAALPLLQMLVIGLFGVGATPYVGMNDFPPYLDDDVVRSTCLLISAPSILVLSMFIIRNYIHLQRINVVKELMLRL